MKMHIPPHPISLFGTVGLNMRSFESVCMSVAIIVCNLGEILNGDNVVCLLSIIQL